MSNWQHSFGHTEKNRYEIVAKVCAHHHRERHRIVILAHYVYCNVVLPVSCKIIRYTDAIFIFVKKTCLFILKLHQKSNSEETYMRANTFFKHFFFFVEHFFFLSYFDVCFLLLVLCCVGFVW